MMLNGNEPEPPDLERHFFGPSDAERRRIEQSEYNRRRSEWKGFHQALGWLWVVLLLCSSFSGWFFVASGIVFIAWAVIGNNWHL